MCRRTIDAIAIAGIIGMIGSLLPLKVAGSAPVASQPAAQPLIGAQAGGVWQTIARSAEGRPIEMARFGRGPARVLIVGPLAGDDVAALGLIDHLADHLSRFPERCGNTTIAILRLPNPDGYVARTRTNARGVDLDRNFGSSTWRKVPAGKRWLSGRLPESEPETRTVVAVLNDFRPERVVLVGSSSREASIGHSPSGEPWAQALAVAWEVPIMPPDPQSSSGSLASYVGGDLKLPVLSLGVPRESPSPESLWASFGNDMLAAVTSPAPGAPQQFAAAAPQSPPAAPAPPQPAAPTAQLDSGLDRLPPTGEETEPRRPPATPVSTAARDDAGQPGYLQTPMDRALAPRLLTVEELKTAASLVPVMSPRARRQQTPPLSAPLAEPPKRTNLLNPRIQRLPPVEKQVPTQAGNGSIPQPKVDSGRNAEADGPHWPQAPIPFYPQTPR